MKKYIWGLLTVVFFISMRTLVYAKGAQVTVRGKLVDAACYLKFGYTNNNHMGTMACGTRCLVQGSPAGLLKGHHIYILIFPARFFSNDIGKTFQISGKIIQGDLLIPHIVKILENGKMQKVSIAGVTMM
jgi:hypothetical protein